MNHFRHVFKVYKPATQESHIDDQYRCDYQTTELDALKTLSLFRPTEKRHELERNGIMVHTSYVQTFCIRDGVLSLEDWTDRPEANDDNDF